MITAFNDTDFRRREHVIFHTNEPTTCTCFTVPGGSLNVAVVDFDPREHGEVEPIQDGHQGTFLVHPAVQEAMASNLKFNATINGRTQEFTFQDRVVDHRRVRIDRWKLRDEGAASVSEGTFWLWTYTFHQQATIRYELLFLYENLAAISGQVNLGFSVTGPTNLRELVAYHFANPASLVSGYTMNDAQGIYAEGCMPFETAEMRANRTTNAEAVTQSAQMLMPLYALVPHATWGLWGAPPLTAPLVTATHRDIEFGRRKAFVGVDPATGGEGPREPRDPSQHLGVINRHSAAGSGTQAEFGAWHFVMNELGGPPDARSLWYQHTATMRQLNRPVWYTENDGEVLDPATNFYMGDGSNAKCWFETIHWGQSAANRFRRTHGVGAPGPWFGHDQQHKGWGHLAADCLLSGSFAARHLLTSIQSVLNCEYPDVDTNEARGVGRMALQAAWTYWATGVDVGLRYFATQVWPYVYNRWDTVLCDAADAYRPYGTNNEPEKQGFLAGTWYWMPWQVASMAAGLDALLRMDAIANVFTSTQRTEIEEVLGHQCVAIVNAAFAPAHGPCPPATTVYADAARFTAAISLGTGPRPVGALLVPADYCLSADLTPTKMVGYNDISVSWYLMAVPIAARVDPALTARANLILGIHRGGLAGNIGDLQHIGTA